MPKIHDKSRNEPRREMKFVEPKRKTAHVEVALLAAIIAVICFLAVNFSEFAK